MTGFISKVNSYSCPLISVSESWMDREVEILDTTLRDGRQNIRATISEPDMMELVKMLDDLGVHIIELGFPSRSSKDMKRSRTCEI